MPIHRSVRTTAMAALVLVVLSGCGGSPASTHDDADVTFAQQMTAHHQQAIEMADLAADRAGDPQVVDLAVRISDAQGPEIELMQGWLDYWGAPTEGSSADMGGAMSEADMDELAASSGADFDRRFLMLMTEHHQGAVEMARTEQADGADPDAIALAGRIIADQSAQLTEMQTLLAQL